MKVVVNSGDRVMVRFCISLKPVVGSVAFIIGLPVPVEMLGVNWKFAIATAADDPVLYEVT